MSKATSETPDKIKTGIKGFDELVQGGLPIGKTVILTGSPGTGKTIFALEYLYNGATKFKEKGLYVSFEESIDHLYQQADQFGWDFKALGKKGLVEFMHIPPEDIKENTAAELIKIIEKKGINRLVIDSVSALSINVPTTFHKVTEITEFLIRRFLYYFFSSLRKLKNTTTIAIAQTKGKEITGDGVSEFIADGIILVTYESMGGEFSRSLTIRKMREVKNDEDIHPVEISNKGIVIHTIQ